MGKLTKLWDKLLYKKREVHAVDMNGVLCVSKKTYNEISKTASYEHTPSIHAFYGVHIVQSDHLPYKEKVKRWSL